MRALCLLYIVTFSISLCAVCNGIRFVGEISKEKCREYSKYSYEYVYSSVLNTYEKKSTCFQNSFLVSSYAELRQFPYAALLGFGPPDEEEWLCNGALISENYVLTSAHCTHSQEYGIVRWVRLGDHNINSLDDPVETQEFEIIERVIHPEFHPKYLYNDIALLKLNTSANFNRFVKPACLYDKSTFNFGSAYLSGWQFPERGVLRKLIYNIERDDNCRRTYHGISRALKNNVDSYTQFCATSQETLCTGQIDGMLQVFNNDNHCMFDIFGIANKKTACGDPTPVLYTRITPFLKWIENTVWPEISK